MKKRLAKKMITRLHLCDHFGESFTALMAYFRDSNKKAIGLINQQRKYSEQ